jgi:hypothetical protein
VLRLGAAIATAIAVSWYLAVEPAPGMWVCALLVVAVIAAFAWVVMGLRSQKRVGEPRCFLRLDREALVLADGEERAIAWDAVENVEIDLERLVVRVAVRDAPECVIEPRFGRLGVYDLEAAIKRAWEEVRSESSKREG